MSKEVIAAISHTYDLASYSTSELLSLFNEWLEEIERLVADFVITQKIVDPDKIANHFNISNDSAIFIISKLARAGIITMQATGKVKCKDNIWLLKVKK